MSKAQPTHHDYGTLIGPESLGGSSSKRSLDQASNLIPEIRADVDANLRQVSHFGPGEQGYNVASSEGVRNELLELRQSLPQILTAALKEVMREGGLGGGGRKDDINSSGKNAVLGQESKEKVCHRNFGTPDEDSGWWQQCIDMTEAISPTTKGDRANTSACLSVESESPLETTPNTNVRTSARLARKRGGEYVDGEDVLQRAIRRKEQGARASKKIRLRPPAPQRSDRQARGQQDDGGTDGREDGQIG